MQHARGMKNSYILVNKHQRLNFGKLHANNLSLLIRLPSILYWTWILESWAFRCMPFCFKVTGLVLKFNVTQTLSSFRSFDLHSISHCVFPLNIMIISFYTNNLNNYSLLYISNFTGYENYFSVHFYRLHNHEHVSKTYRIHWHEIYISDLLIFSRKIF
jgi:hypothetical protein